MIMRFLPFALLLTACGPVSVQQAEKECLWQAQNAEHPRGKVSLGVGSDGKTRLGGELTVTSDFLQGHDPSQVYNNCVVRRSGEFPTRPYSSTPAAHR